MRSPEKNPELNSQNPPEAQETQDEIKQLVSESLLNLTEIEIENPKNPSKRLKLDVSLELSDKNHPEIHLTNPAENGEKVGFIRFCKIEPKENEERPGRLYGGSGENKNHLWLDMLRIEEKYRGKGISPAILEVIREESERLGCEGRIKLQAISEYGVPSAVVCHKLGFRMQPGAAYFGDEFEETKELLEKAVREGKKYSAEEHPFNVAMMYLPEKEKS